ncbi:hypothetical protein KAI12_02360 [Candidatus Bathyarchaeota archaeon]|nr:hypothetical protein [Candidatus Bathyarchaeota archaeon]
MRLTEHFLDLQMPLLFDVMLHFGTLIATLFFFRKDLANLMLALFKLDFKSENG